MLNPIERFEFFVSEFEKGLNFGGYIPGVNCITGNIRLNAFGIFLVGSLAVGCLALLGSELTANPDKRAKFEATYEKAFDYSKHAVANIFRSVIEIYTPLYLGGIALYVFYDMHDYRMKYPTEDKAKEFLEPVNVSILDLPRYSRNLIHIFE